MKNIFYAAGLPRSGSTLALNIFAQNPDIHPTVTSPLLGIIDPIRTGWRKIDTFRTIPEEEALKTVKGIMSGALYGAFDHVDKPYIISKNRGWLGIPECLEEITKNELKFLVFVRNIPEILASLELLYRKTRRLSAIPQESPELSSIEKRCDFWVRSDQLLGGSYNLIKEAVNTGYGENMLFIKYEDLTTYPKIVIEKVYQFLEIPTYNHDFENIQQVLFENDLVHGFTGLHTIKPKIEKSTNRAASIIGEDMVKKYSGGQFW